MADRKKLVMPKTLPKSTNPKEAEEMGILFLEALKKEEEEHRDLVFERNLTALKSTDTKRARELLLAAIKAIKEENAKYENFETPIVKYNDPHKAAKEREEVLRLRKLRKEVDKEERRKIRERKQKLKNLKKH